MAKTVKVNGVTYDSVPAVDIPLAEGNGNATFHDTSGDDVIAAHVLAGDKFHGADGEGTGTMPNNGGVEQTISEKDGSVTIQKGYHDGTGAVTLSDAAKQSLVEENIKAGAVVLGVSGKSSVVDTDDADAAAAHVYKDKIVYVKGVRVVGTLTAASVSQDSTTKVLTIQ